MSLRHTFLITLWIIFLIAMGCSRLKMTSPAIATLPGISHHFLKGQIVDLESDKAISFEELICRFASIDLLFVGEIHDNPEHHLLQIQILQALADTSFPITLGVEFFQENQQDTLDRYLKWEFAEEEFLRELNWKREWGFDYHLYRPLILFARQNGIRILALNAPREIVRKVAREGLKTLDPEERSQIALDIDLANEAHRAYVKDAYAEHSHGDLRDFELFYEAQCVWDETMAENLAEHSWGSRELVVVFAGNGHIAYKFGIPDRTARRRPVSVATILLLPLSETTVLEKAIADYVWLTSDCRNKGERSN